MKHVIGLTLAGIMTAGVALAEGREVRIASHVSELSPLHAQSVMFAEKVNAQLPGQFDFKIFPGGQLGRESALIDNLQLGSLEMINVASGVMKIDGHLGIFDLPWLFDSREHVKRAMAAGLEDKVASTIEAAAGVKVVGIYENGFRHVINSARAINAPADIAGMKVRISGGKFREGVFESMGAVPAKVAWGETFTAMQTGVVDGAEAAVYGFYEMKMHEVQKFLSMTSHVYTPSFLMASEDFWNSLTDEQRLVFVNVAEEIRDPSYARAAELEETYLADMKATIAVNAADIPAFREQVKSVYTTYTDAYGQEWLDVVESAR